MSVAWEQLSQMSQQIRQLSQQLNEQLADFNDLVAALEHQEQLTGRLSKPLRGLKLAVVGPSFRQDAYRTTLEPLGATFLFAPSDEKLGKVDQICGKAHGIIFITTYASHKVDEKLQALSTGRCIPLRRLTQKGLERLRECALELRDDMICYKDLTGA